MNKEKIKLWLKNPANLILLLILIFSFSIRLYFFFVAQNQPLWWDEAEYLSTAKHWASSVPYDINPQRPPLFQFLSAIVFLIGLGENFIKFFFVLLPSTFMVFSVYLLGKEMFDKKIGLIAAFLVSITWTFLFWTSRVQPDFISMTFQVLAITFIWKYWKSPKSKTIILSGIFAALGFYFKISALLIPVIFIVFILLKDRLSAFKNKDYYYFALSYIVSLIPFFIWSYFTFNDPIAIFHSGYSGAVSTPTPLAWSVLPYFYTLTESLFFVLFLIGLFISLKFLIYPDILVKDKSKVFDPNIFSLLSLIIITAFYVCYIKGIEDRWVFLWIPFISFYAAGSLMFIYKFAKKYSKYFAILLVLGLLLFVAYAHIQHSDSLITSKKTSYLQVKEAGLWLKENTNKEDKIWCLSLTQMTYYAERNVTNYNKPLTSSALFEKYLEDNHINYVVWSVFESVPLPWFQNWSEENQDNLEIQNVYYSDASQTQPLLAIFKRIKP